MKTEKNLHHSWKITNPKKPEETEEQIHVLADSIRRYKKFRRNQLLYHRPEQQQQHPLASKKMSSQDQGGHCAREYSIERNRLLDFYLVLFRNGLNKWELIYKVLL